MLLVAIYGITAGVLLSIELMSNKWLMVRRSIFGNVTGIFFLLIEGIIGTICLTVTTFNGGGLYELSQGAFWMLILAGAFGFASLILLNLAISIGNAGVAVSIFNTAPALQCILASVWLGQFITTG